MTLPRIHVGAPVHRGALTLFPLWTEHAEPTGDYVTGPAAEAAKTLVVDELDQATVPQLLAKNHGETPVLLVEGEVLAGGLQTRVLNLSVLVPAMQDLAVPVACVEAGRWGDRRRARRGATHSPPTLRRHKTASVNHASARAAPRRPGRGLGQRGYVRAAARCALAYELLRRCRRPAPAGPRLGDGGTGAASGSARCARRRRRYHARTRAVRPVATFADYFDSILAGYAIEALAAEPVPTPSTQARRFIRRLAAASWSTSDAVGLGREITIEGEGITGTGLALEDERPPVHIAAFA